MGPSFLDRSLRVSLRFFLWVEDWVLPPVCLHCGSRRHASFPLCLACLRVIRDSRPEEDEAVSGFPWIRALFRLTPPLHALIHGFKYRHQRRHIRFLARWMRWRRAWAADLARTYDALVPVPLHPARRRERGYNQAEALARALSHMEPRPSAGGSPAPATSSRTLPTASRALRRVRFTGTQTRLKGGARARNLEDAFRARTRGVAGKSILLIDDVCTTGSTLAHCREELLRAGAIRVDALVLAWVEKRGSPASGVDLETASAFFS